MLLLHLTTCFNLLDAICRQTDRDATLRAQRRGWGWLSMDVHQCVCIYIHRVSAKETASGVKHSLHADSTEGWQQHQSDWFMTNWLPDWLIDWFDCVSSLGGGVSGGSGVEGVLKCFIESGLIDSTAKRYRRLFPLLPACSRWALWARMLAFWMGANNISDALAYAHTGLRLQTHLFSTKSMHLFYYENRFYCMQRDTLTFQFRSVAYWYFLLLTYVWGDKVKSRYPIFSLST